MTDQDRKQSERQRYRRDKLTNTTWEKWMASESLNMLPEKQQIELITIIIIIIIIIIK